MITTVYFDNINSLNDLGLILAKRKIGTPKVKKRMVEIPGGSPLDYSDFFGDVEFENRTINLSFNAEADKDQGTRLYQKIQNEIHGKKMKIRFSDEPDFYYIGRIEVGEYEPRRTVFKIDVTIDAEPYKLKKEKTTKQIQVNNSAEVVLNNLRMRTVPEITCSSEMTIKKGLVNLTIPAQGTFKYPELQLEKGENHLTVTGNGTITFSYQEGEL